MLELAQNIKLYFPLAPHMTGRLSGFHLSCQPSGFDAASQLIVSELHDENAQLPIEVTLSGIVMFVSEVQ